MDAHRIVRPLHGLRHWAMTLGSYLISLLIGFTLGAICCGILCAHIYA